MTQPSSETPPEDWGWTRPQRIILAILLLALFTFFAIQYYRRPFRFDDQAVTLSGTPLTLPTRLDPNTATLEQLTTITHLPEKTADNIITWRTAHIPTADAGIVFHSLQDLTPIPGLNKKTLDQLRPLLQFPDDAQTQPTPQ